MKKWLSRVLVICLLICAVQAFAEGSTTYHVDKLGLSIDIPDNILVYIPGQSIDDRLPALFGSSKTDFDEIMASLNVCLVSYDFDTHQEIDIVRTENSTDMNFEEYSDEELNFLISGLKATLEAQGHSDIRSEVYQTAENVFIKICTVRKAGDDTTYTLGYTVATDDAVYAVNITSGAEIDAESELRADAMIDTVCFDE